jgi:hypothetical protein
MNAIYWGAALQSVFAFGLGAGIALCVHVWRSPR